MAKKINDAVEAITAAAEDAKEAVQTAADGISANAEGAAEVVKKTVKRTAKKAAQVAEEKAPETTEKVKKAATKAKKAVKDIAPVQETYFEVFGQQIMAEEIVAKIKEAYKAEGHRVTSIRSLKTYVNINEHKAYYIINEKEEGKYVEF